MSGFAIRLSKTLWFMFSWGYFSNICLLKKDSGLGLVIASWFNSYRELLNYSGKLILLVTVIGGSGIFIFSP